MALKLGKDWLKAQLKRQDAWTHCRGCATLSPCSSFCYLAHGLGIFDVSRVTTNAPRRSPAATISPSQSKSPSLSIHAPYRVRPRLKALDRGIAFQWRPRAERLLVKGKLGGCCGRFATSVPVRFRCIIA